jgi:Dynamin family
MDDQFSPMILSRTGLTAEARRKKRAKKKSLSVEHRQGANDGQNGFVMTTGMSDDRFADLLKLHEDELLKFVAQVNHVYQDKLKKNAPFMTFMFCGMQSAGKSTIMERFVNAVLNIVREGTGTRCPLDTTCIHDANCIEPECDLHGDELARSGKNLTVRDIFQRITEHNRKLGDDDRFSTEPLRLVYRAHNVQNMRFVDTPGIISTKGTGKDNREDIKRILRNEMSKPNTKLCVLLEPKEFETNEIVNFCDETFGERDKWIRDATFLMTKFDKQLEDSRTGSKANNFFGKFHDNGCFPHLVITPTLPKEDLPPVELFEARLDLLHSSDKVEKERFAAWRDGHERFRQENPSDDALNPEIMSRIGFKSAKTVMREIMLQDTVKRLPEVLAELRNELSSLQKEQKILEEKKKFSDPVELKSVVATILYEIEQRINSYLDGDLESAVKFPEKLQSLEEEIEDEELSEWAEKELNHYTEAENHWRNRIADFEGEYPEAVQPDKKFLGGKQVQRAIEFFRAVMIEALPDPFQLKEIVGNATGFLGGGLQRENWERAMVQITRVCVKQVTHPGINYLIKHVGCIFRRLFSLALEDVKHGEELSATFKLLPTAVEKHFLIEFDDLLWGLMENVASMTHLALEPMVRILCNRDLLMPPF